jgi:hypothetical protein
MVWCVGLWSVSVGLVVAQREGMRMHEGARRNKSEERGRLARCPVTSDVP